jgi:hypothetical protein
MNWFLIIIFLLVIFPFWYLLGRQVLKFFNYDYHDENQNVVIGFFAFFFEAFIVGIPATLLKVSWNVYYIAMLAVFILTIAFLLYKERNFIKENVFNKKFFSYVRNHLKRNWVIYLMTAVFMVMYVTNAMAYYKMNYDDRYYIGKAVQLVGTPQLMNENYYTGALLTHTKFDLIRVINTFELTYAFLGTTFHISVPFFIKIGMGVAGYIITFMSFKMFIEIFIDKKYSQFALLSLSVLLIPRGYTANTDKLFMNINMYSQWHFQTAIYYGGSFVQHISLPLILFFSKDLLDKINYKKLLFIGLLSITFVSFSTTYLTYFIMLLIGLIGAKILKLIYDTTRDKTIVVGAIILLTISLLILNTVGYELIRRMSKTTIDAYKSYRTFYKDRIALETLLIWTPFIYMIIMSLFKKKWLLVSLIIMFGIPFSGKLNALMSLATVNYPFVGGRYIASIELLTMIFIGIIIVSVLRRIKYKQLLLTGLAVVTVLGTVFYIKRHMYDITRYSSGTTGITYAGYRASIPFKNDKMLPDVIVKIGEYFDKLPYGNYRVFAPYYADYEGTQIRFEGLSMASNRIELVYPKDNYHSFVPNGAGNMDNEEYDLLMNFSQGNVEKNIQYVIKKYKIDYLVVSSSQAAKALSKSGYELIQIDKDNKLFLLHKS